MAVELALILPLLVTIVLGCIDFGRFGYAYVAVTNAARVGAGVASFNPVTSTTTAQWEALIRDAVAREMEGVPGYDAANLTVPTPDISVDPGGLRRVRVQVTYVFDTVVNWPLLPASGFPLSRDVEMRFIR
jgi:Flp pilus assembly protein TadG